MGPNGLLIKPLGCGKNYFFFQKNLHELVIARFKTWRRKLSVYYAAESYVDNLGQLTWQ